MRSGNQSIPTALKNDHLVANYHSIPYERISLVEKEENMTKKVMRSYENYSHFIVGSRICLVNDNQFVKIYHKGIIFFFYYHYYYYYLLLSLLSILIIYYFHYWMLSRFIFFLKSEKSLALFDSIFIWYELKNLFLCFVKSWTLIIIFP